MNNKDTDFELWFEMLQMNLADAGITFNDSDSVRQDYEDGKSMFDVMDEIKDEYES